MAEEEGKKEEEKLEFTPEGETLGYISLDQARVLALQHARDNREFYGRYADAELVWDVVGAEETEDYYEIRLAYRPAGNFRAAGIEQFTIDKTGPIEFRQIIRQPRLARGIIVSAAAVIALAATGATIGGLFASGALTTGDAPAPLITTVPITPDAPARLSLPMAT